MPQSNILPDVTITTWKSYATAAMRTCTDSSRNKAYMSLGLMSEAGEVAGKIAKLIRDDEGALTDTRKQEIAAELGDVLWMVAGILQLPDNGLFKDFVPSALLGDDALKQGAHSLYAKRDIVYLSATLLQKCNAVGRTLIANNLRRHWWEFDSIVKIIATIAAKVDTSLLAICQHNINKLTDRYNRNVIAGSGDNR